LCFVEWISRALLVWVVLATMFTGHETLRLFCFGAASKIVSTDRTNSQSVQELQTEIGTGTEDITGDIMRDTADKFLVRSQRAHEVKRNPY
jgi:hypothetical protein